MRNLPTVDNELLEQVVRIILAIANPERIVLFGSFARGESGAESDIDLLVVEPEKFGPHLSRRKRMARISRALSRLHVPADLLLYSSDEVEYWRDSASHVVSRALREGETLYERH